MRRFSVATTCAWGRGAFIGPTPHPPPPFPTPRLRFDDSYTAPREPPAKKKEKEAAEEGEERAQGGDPRDFEGGPGGAAGGVGPKAEASTEEVTTTTAISNSERGQRAFPRLGFMRRCHSRSVFKIPTEEAQYPPVG